MELADVTGHEESRRPGLADAPVVFAAPASLFRRVEDTATYAWTLAVLLIFMTLVGYLRVQTGLVDRVVDLQTERELAVLESAQRDLVDRVALRDEMDSVRKNGEFMKLVGRLKAIVATPVSLLVSILFVSSMLFAAVALTGRKPEYHTLMNICVFAGFIDLAGEALQLLMMLAYRTTQVGTSLDMLLPPGKAPYLAGIDPMAIWYWIVVFIGVTVTQQLSRRAALTACITLFVLGAALRTAGAMMTA
ncbi:Yip1 domain protein [Phycisphaerae bacterium RAS2]|nr:Yip1 domain protein [Phycisphaerae bacterium RAS2]